MPGRGGGVPPWQRQHVHDSIRPFRLTVALGLKTGMVWCNRNKKETEPNKRSFGWYFFPPCIYFTSSLPSKNTRRKSTETYSLTVLTRKWTTKQTFHGCAGTTARDELLQNAFSRTIQAEQRKILSACARNLPSRCCQLACRSDPHLTPSTSFRECQEFSSFDMDGNRHVASSMKSTAAGKSEHTAVGGGWIFSSSSALYFPAWKRNNATPRRSAEKWVLLKHTAWGRFWTITKHLPVLTSIPCIPHLIAPATSSLASWKQRHEVGVQWTGGWHDDDTHDSIRPNQFQPARGGKTEKSNKSTPAKSTLSVW